MQTSIDTTVRCARAAAKFLMRPSEDPQKAIVQVASGGNKDSHIAAGDLLEMDFTVNTVAFDGVYLVSFDDEWIGLRVIQVVPDECGTGLHIKENGAFHKLASSIVAGMKVHGFVNKVYRPS